MRNKIMSLFALIIALLFSGAADGIMCALGIAGFMLAGLIVMGAAYIMVEVSNA